MLERFKFWRDRGKAEVVERNLHDEALALKRAFDRQRVGVTSLDPFPQFMGERLFQWPRKVAIAYACVSKMVEAAQDPDLIVQRRTAGGVEWQVEQGHPFRRLMMRPNWNDATGESATQADFLGQWIASEQCCGIFFAEIVRAKRSKKPAQLWPLDPTLMRRDPETGLYEFWYMGARETFDNNRDLFVSMLPDFQRPWTPLSPLQVALGSVVADYYQSAFVRSFFKNGGVPSGVIKLKNTILAGEQGKQRVREIKERWMEEYGAMGKYNQGPAVLDDNAEYQKVGVNLEEIEGSVLRQVNESDICAAFGVNPLLVQAYVGLVNVNQRATAKEALKDFWVSKMSPYFKRIRMILQSRFLGEWEVDEDIYDERVRVFWNMDSVSAMQEEIGNRDMRLRESFRAGAITLYTYLTQMGLPATEADKYYLRRANQIPITAEVIAAQVEAASLAAARAVSLVLTGTSDPNTSEISLEDIEEMSNNGQWPVVGGQSTGERKCGGCAGGRRKSSFKTYDWEGVPCSREPTEIERKIRLVETGKAIISGETSLQAILNDARPQLVTQAIERLRQLSPEYFHELTLSFPVAEGVRLREELSILFDRGRELLHEEVRRQDIEVSGPTHSAGAAEMERLASLTISRVLNGFQAFVINQAGALALLTDAEFEERLRVALDEAKMVFIKLAAAEASNLANSAGREAGMKDVLDQPVKFLRVRKQDEPPLPPPGPNAGYVYFWMAVMDAHTCDWCEEMDLAGCRSRYALPYIPYYKCPGWGRCRCRVSMVYFDPRPPDSDRCLEGGLLDS